MSDHTYFIVGLALGIVLHWLWSLKVVGDLKRENEKLNDSVAVLTSRDSHGRFTGKKK